MKRFNLSCLLLLTACSVALAGDVSPTPIVSNGSDAERFDVVLVAEGFTADEQQAFADAAGSFADALLATPPFANNCSALNVWSFGAVSGDSGAADPAECGGSGSEIITAYGASFCADGATRSLMSLDDAGVIADISAAIPGWDQILVIVNSQTDGGSDGQVAIATLAGNWQRTAIHSIGHSAFGLADEYDYFAGCGIDLDNDVHPAIEPAAANATINTDPASIKWADLIDDGTAVPTTNNADCTLCDPQPDPFPGDTVVGAFEGAHHFHCDGYRPAFSCMMRDFSDFCPVCSARILAVLDPFQPADSAPSCDAGGPYTAECAGDSTPVELNGSASSDADCDELSFSWTGDFDEESLDGAMPTGTFSGVMTFDVELTVGAGEADSTCAAEVTVEDTLIPDISVIDVSAECTSPDGTPVDLGEPTTADICDSELDVANDAPDLFPLGDTDVIWTATDDSGNQNSATQLVTVADTTPPDLTAPDGMTVECGGHDGTPVDIGEPTVSDVCDAEVDVTNDAPALFPLGTTIVTWTATDDSGNTSTATQEIVVVDTTPPMFTTMSLSPTMMWPPNHRMRTVNAHIQVFDICDPDPGVLLDSIVSNEPDNGLGDGNTEPDIQDADFGSDDRQFQLRAERSGKGDGRVYSVTYSVTDESGNASTAVTTVNVPHDRRKRPNQGENPGQGQGPGSK